MRQKLVRFKHDRTTWLNVQRYVWVCSRYYTKDPDKVKDLVQEVLTTFLEKNVNLQELTKRYIYLSVRFASYRYYQQFECVWNGSSQDKVSFISDYEFVQPEEEEEEDYLIRGRKKLQALKPVGDKLHDQVLRMLIEGQTISEISWRLNRTNDQVSAICRYAIKLKKIMLTNPINGSKLKITKQISLGSWEKKIDQEDYEDTGDGNEFYQLYRHKESGDGLLVKLPAAKTNPYIK